MKKKDDYNPKIFFGNLFKFGIYDVERLRAVTAKKHLTQRDFEEITGEKYKNGK